MSATWDDERIARLVGNGGVEGMARYGLYWRINEILAAKMDGENPSCSICYPISVWSRLLVTRGSLVFSTLSTLAVTGLVTVERHDSDIRVTNRNLLKYRDEYTRKSGHASDKVAPDTEQIQIQIQKQKKPSARSVPPEELAGTLPLVSGKNYQISKAQMAEWSEAYPAVNVKQQLLEFKAWLNANPTRRKTDRGICRAIVGWLSRKQDRGNINGNTGGKGNGRGNEIFEALAESLREDQDGPRADGHVSWGETGREDALSLCTATLEGKA